MAVVRGLNGRREREAARACVCVCGASSSYNIHIHIIYVDMYYTCGGYTRTRVILI